MNQAHRFAVLFIVTMLSIFSGSGNSWGVLNLRLQVWFIVKAVIQNKVTQKLCIYVLTDEVAMGHRNDERACVRPSVRLSPDGPVLLTITWKSTHPFHHSMGA